MNNLHLVYLSSLLLTHEKQTMFLFLQILDDHILFRSWKKMRTRRITSESEVKGFERRRLFRNTVNVYVKAINYICV